MPGLVKCKLSYKPAENGFYCGNVNCPLSTAEGGEAVTTYKSVINNSQYCIRWLGTARNVSVWVLNYPQNLNYGHIIQIIPFQPYKA